MSQGSQSFDYVCKDCGAVMHMNKEELLLAIETDNNDRIKLRCPACEAKKRQERDKFLTSIFKTYKDVNK